MKTFEDLRVWQEAIDLSIRLYLLTDGFPRHERFGLTAQMRRAAVSVPANIAEGQGRFTPGEWLQFLGHARGSLYELRTLLVIAERLKYVDGTQRTQLMEITDAVGKTLSGLIKYVSSKR